VAWSSPPAPRPAPSRVAPDPHGAKEDLRELAGWVVLAGAGCVVALVGIGFWQGIRLLLRPHPDAATVAVAVAVAMVLAATLLPPGIGWITYRRMWPPARSSPWEGGVVPPDPATQAELMASPAGAIGRALTALLGCVVLTVIALTVAPLAWVAAVPAAVLTVFLVARMLRPTRLVVNGNGFGVRAQRYEQCLAVPWSDVAEVVRAEGDRVVIVPSPPRTEPRVPSSSCTAPGRRALTSSPPCSAATSTPTAGGGQRSGWMTAPERA
jgi:hypothetical protein